MATSSVQSKNDFSRRVERNWSSWQMEKWARVVYSNSMRGTKVVGQRRTRVGGSSDSITWLLSIKLDCSVLKKNSTILKKA